MAPPPRLRVDPAAAPPLCRVAPGPSGLRLVEDPGGVAGETVPAPPLAPSLAGPVPVDGLELAQGGRLVVGWSAGVARSITVAEMGQMFDRRPAGLVEVVGAATANAALLRADDGWRAVVLPSLGDRLTGLGDGPVAIAPDGLRVAVTTADGVEEMALADGSVVARHPGGATALAYGADGTLLAARNGAVVHAGDGPADGGGPEVRALRAAAQAPVAVALDAEGGLRVHGLDGAGRFLPSVGTPTAVQISPDGAWLLVTTADGVALLRATDGALAVRVRGVRAGVLLPDGRLVVGGEWGVAALVPVTD